MARNPSADDFETLQILLEKLKTNSKELYEHGQNFQWMVTHKVLIFEDQGAGSTQKFIGRRYLNPKMEEGRGGTEVTGPTPEACIAKLKAMP